MDVANNVDGVHMHLENKKISRQFFWMLWMMYAVVCMTKNCYAGAMAAIVNEGILTKSQTGMINVVFYAVYAPLQIVGGVFADRYNPERMIKLALVGSGIANLIIFFNQDYHVMLLTWLFNAIAQFAIWPSVFKIISSQLEPVYRIKGVYYISFSSVFGLVMSYLVAAIVTKWQYNFLISAISLFVFALVFLLSSTQVERHMVPDDTKIAKNLGVNPDKAGVPTWKLFLVSGFFCLVLANGARNIINNSIKTISATLLMESYETISPSFGNLLNILIIIAGVLGIMFVNQFIHPRLIRHEIVASLILTIVGSIAVVVLVFVGRVHAIVIVGALFMASLILSGAEIVTSRCTAAFAEYGKNGIAAGVNNSLAAVAIVIQNYTVLSVADDYGWKAAVILWIALLAVAVMFLAIATPLWSRFRSRKIHM